VIRLRDFQYTPMIMNGGFEARTPEALPAEIRPDV
jgi:hypothetical protein